MRFFLLWLVGLGLAAQSWASCNEPIFDSVFSTDETSHVTSVAVDADVIIGGGFQKIRIWNRTNYNIIKTIAGSHSHSRYIYTLALDNTFLVSGGNDQIIKIWDRANNFSLHHNIHTNDTTYAIAMDADIIVSGSYDDIVKVWNRTDNYKLITTLTGHIWYVYSVALDADIIVSGSVDKTIKVWDRNNNYNHITTLRGHYNEIVSVALDAGVIVSGSWDKTIKVWDRNNNYRLIKTLGGHTHGVRSVAMDAGVIVSGSDDNTIKVWDRDCIQTTTTTTATTTTPRNATETLEAGQLAAGFIIPIIFGLGVGGLVIREGVRRMRPVYTALRDVQSKAVWRFA